MKVYIVGHAGPEHNDVISVHRSYGGALKAWNKVRIDLLKDARRLMKNSKYDKKMWLRMIKNLSCRNPKKIDNYPQETPYIGEREVLE